MKLDHISTLKALIYLQTGLHIGAGNDTVSIGGLDQPIIKNPRTDAPYIPGSSIKGKMRSLLETGVAAAKRKKTAEYVEKGNPCACGESGCPICTLFGAPADKCAEDLGPTRMLVRDAELTETFAEMQKNNELPMEIKYENTINRLKGTADHPRPLERVPAGVCFNLNISLRIYEGDPEQQMLDWIKAGLLLLELDALGGCSSRGCGQIIFKDLEYNKQPLEADWRDKVDFKALSSLTKQKANG